MKRSSMWLGLVAVALSISVYALACGGNTPAANGIGGPINTGGLPGAGGSSSSNPPIGGPINTGGLPGATAKDAGK